MREDEEGVALVAHCAGSVTDPGRNEEDYGACPCCVSDTDA